MAVVRSGNFTCGYAEARIARHTVLSEINPFTKEDDLRIVIETPRGSRNKYSYDPDCDCMQLSTVLPEGLVFPYDFGFVPSTLGQDGDPLDILILMDEPVVPGCVVRARLIGAIQAEQKEKGEGWIRNDRLIAVATASTVSFPPILRLEDTRDRGRASAALRRGDSCQGSSAPDRATTFLCP